MNVFHSFFESCHFYIFNYAHMLLGSGYLSPQVIKAPCHQSCIESLRTFTQPRRRHKRAKQPSKRDVLICIFIWETCSIGSSLWLVECVHTGCLYRQQPIKWAVYLSGTDRTIFCDSDTESKAQNYIKSRPRLIPRLSISTSRNLRTITYWVSQDSLRSRSHSLSCFHWSLLGLILTS